MILLSKPHPEFEKHLEETNNLVDQLDTKIINFESQINKTVKERLYNFELVKQSDKPVIIDYINIAKIYLSCLKIIVILMNLI